MEDNTYNGWSNRETWLVNLWVSNDPYGTETITNHLLGEASSEMYLLDVEESTKDCVYEMFVPEEFDSGFVADMFNTSFAQVNWREFIENYISDMDELYIMTDLEDRKRLAVREEED